MGDIADMMMEGILCHGCGGLMDDVTEDSPIAGYPRLCEDCEGEPDPCRHVEYDETLGENYCGK